MEPQNFLVQSTLEVVSLDSDNEDAFVVFTHAKEIDKYQIDIKQLQEENAKLTENIEQYKSIKKLQDDEIVDIKRKMEEVIKKKEIEMAKQSEDEAKIIQLNEQSQNLYKKLTQVEGQLNTRDEVCESLKKELKKIQEELSSKIKYIEQLKIENVSLKSELQSLKEAMEVKNQEVVSRENANQKLLHTLREENEYLKELLDEEEERTEKDLSQKTTEINKLKSELQTIISRKAATDELLDSVKEESMKYRRETDDLLERRCKELHQRSEEKNQLKNELQALRDATEAKNTEAASRERATQQLLQKRHEENERLKKHIDDLHEECQKELHKKSIEIKELRNELEILGNAKEVENNEATLRERATQLFLQTRHEENERLKEHIGDIKERCQKELHKKLVKINEMETEMEKLQEQINEFKSKDEDIRQLKDKHSEDLASKDGEIRNLEDELKTLKIEIQAAVSSQNEMKCLVNTTKEQNAMLQSQAEELFANNIHLKRIVTNYEPKLIIKHRKIEELQELLKCVENSHDKTKSSFAKKLDDAIQASKEKIQEALSKVTDMKSLLNTTEEENKRLNSEAQELSARNTELKELVQRKNTEIDELRNELHRLEFKLNDKEDLFVKKCEDSIKRLEEATETAVSNKNKMKILLDTANEEYKKLKTEAEELSVRNEDLQKLVKGHEQELSSKNTKIEQLQNEMNFLEFKFKEKEDSFVKKCEDAREAAETAVLNENKIKSLLDTTNEKYVKLKSEARKLSARNADLKILVAKHEQVISSKNTRIEELEDVMKRFRVAACNENQMESRVKTTKEQNAMLQSQAERLTAKNGNRKQERSSRNAKIKKLESEVERPKLKCKRKEKELQSDKYTKESRHQHYGRMLPSKVEKQSSGVSLKQMRMECVKEVPKQKVNTNKKTTWMPRGNHLCTNFMLSIFAVYFFLNQLLSVISIC